MIRLLLPIAIALISASFAAAAEDHAAARREMVDVIDAIAGELAPRPGLARMSAPVRQVMGRVPRHAFVPESLRDYAYTDRPLPIGHGQTISQPYIVALMTDLLEPGKEDVVLEVGTGSGYQAAVLAELVREVYSIEIIEPLAEGAAGRLRRLGYDNVTVRTGDGYDGWPEHAPFDGIVVTAAASHVPPPLIAQLRPGGRMVIPVGAPFQVQHLMLVKKDMAGEVHSELLLPVRFVPLTGRR